MPLQTVIEPPVLTVTVQPEGKPVCCGVGSAVAIAIGILIWALTLLVVIEPGPVLPTVTCISTVPPRITCPEFSVRIFNVAFACPDASKAPKAPIRKNISHFIRFIFPVCLWTEFFMLSKNNILTVDN